ncbi:MAG: biotin carboxylase [Candidatus Nitrosocaldaceae archaeon]|nr:MAG: biotin carboxylase [Candidatus Nitrosocaldaceae archaeon]
MKINKILIANRGEIAVRVIRACRELGIKSVAVYSDEDIQSLHVKLANEAYHIGPASPVESYLRIDKIIDAAKKAGADAIHPGYGFLSENESFGEACEKEGIIFIGPRKETLALAGDKMACKKIARKAGVPVVPGSDDMVEDVDEAASLAKDIGYPVLLKSAFGGGGRGIRLANNEEQLRQEFNMASMESKAAFGKSALYIEKFLTNIRHIEFQFVRDAYGNAAHIFERECSIQRRHQKLVEMSPSPVVDEETRNRVGGYAVMAGEAVDYLNAGTVEFVRDNNTGNFYFIEINARLQVEHPVTELVSGLDLVKLQIAIASGEELPFKQEDLKLTGAAIECRINAEDPFNDFAPSYGIVKDCRIPYGPGVRVDTYLYPGCNVSGYYDSLVAKIITWGKDFDESRRRMLNALDEFYADGITTAIPLYKAIMNDPAFINGDLSTDYLQKYKLIERLKDISKESIKKNKDAIASAVLVDSLYEGARSKRVGTQLWKERGRFERSFGYGI